jgi:hypothetical protein
MFSDPAETIVANISMKRAQERGEMKKRDLSISGSFLRVYDVGEENASQK